MGLNSLYMSLCSLQMCSKAVMVMMTAVMMMLVMPVSPRPHQTQNGSDKIESVVSESLKNIETVIVGSARKIENVIEEIVREKMSVEDANVKEQGAAVVTAGIAKASPATINSDNKKAVFRNVLAKIFARKRASAMKAAVPLVPGSARDATPIPKTTTTLDPIDEYCKEACEAGVGGPECDCPDHPIG